jgi:hypothetical protein
VSRGATNGVLAGATAVAAPVVRRPECQVLIGECYVDAASGVEIRVVDSRLPVGPAREFVVEANDGSHPGERWVRTAGELRVVARPSAPQACTRGNGDDLAALRHAASLAERLVEAGQTMLGVLAGREHGASLRAVVDKAGQLVSALRQLAAVLEACAGARGTKPGGNAR